jgi:hypothetical protein
VSRHAAGLFDNELMMHGLGMTSAGSDRHQSFDGLAPTSQRAVAAVVGLAAAVGGTFAVFDTTNELGTAALFLVAGAFLLCVTFGVVPTRFKVGDKGLPRVQLTPYL